MMSVGEQKTATIHPFPVRAQPVPVDRLKQAQPSGAHDASPVADTEFGSGWYHEAAVQDIAPANKR